MESITLGLSGVFRRKNAPHHTRGPRGKGVRNPVDDLQLKRKGVLCGNHLSPAISTEHSLTRCRYGDGRRRLRP